MPMLVQRHSGATVGEGVGGAGGVVVGGAVGSSQSATVASPLEQAQSHRHGDASLVVHDAEEHNRGEPNGRVSHKPNAAHVPEKIAAEPPQS